MSAKKRFNFTVAAMLKSIETHRGNRNAIAREHRCSWDTVNNYIQKYERLRQACAVGVEARLDRAEEVLDGHVNGGDLRAAQFLLSTLGKNRGYTTRQEVEGQLNQTYAIEFDDNPPGQLDPSSEAPGTGEDALPSPGPNSDS